MKSTLTCEQIKNIISSILKVIYQIFIITYDSNFEYVENVHSFIFSYFDHGANS